MHEKGHEDRSAVKIVRGKVRSGQDDFGQWLTKLRTHYMAKTGVDLYPGTLNVELSGPYRVPKDCMRLEGWEYGGTVSANIVRWRVFGRKAFILRTDRNESDTGRHAHTTVEIATDVRLRDVYDLQDGDEVDVELDIHVQDSPS